MNTINLWQLKRKTWNFVVSRKIITKTTQKNQMATVLSMSIRRLHPVVMPANILNKRWRWKRPLSPEEYAVTQKNPNRTRAFSNRYWINLNPVSMWMWQLVNPLFHQRTSLSLVVAGPSSTQPISPDVVTYKEDKSYQYGAHEWESVGEILTLAMSLQMGPSGRGGLRYCINDPLYPLYSQRPMEEKAMPIY